MACVLAVQYGMGVNSLAKRINQPVPRAKELLKLHKMTYRHFWAWSDSAVNQAMLNRKLWTTFGWVIHVVDDSNERFLRNFPMQANGSEMLRLACILATDLGISVCATVHDAILIEASLSKLDEAVASTQEVMAKASEIVLDGFSLRSDADIIRYPNRFKDEDGEDMWNKVMGILENLKHQPCQ